MNIIEEAFGKLELRNELRNKKREDNEAYNKGMNDAWELAKKILYGIDKQLIEIFDLKVEPRFFDLTHKRAIINDHTPQEVFEKLEKVKEIKVGDVVNIMGNYCIVTQIDMSDKEYHVIWNDGNTDKIPFDAPLGMKKTGKHIDLTDLFKQIGGAE